MNTCVATSAVRRDNYYLPRHQCYTQSVDAVAEEEVNDMSDVKDYHDEDKGIYIFFDL